MTNPVDRYALIVSVSDEASYGKAASRAEVGLEKKGYEIHRANLVTLPLWVNLLKGRIDQNDQVVFFITYPETDAHSPQADSDPRLKALLDIRSYGQRAVIIHGNRQLGASLPIKPSVIHVDSQDQIDHFVRSLKPDQAVFVNFSPVWCGPCKPYQVDYAMQAEQVGSGCFFLQTDNEDLAVQYYNVSAFPAVVRINPQGEPYYMSESGDLLGESSRIGLYFDPETLVLRVQEGLQNPYENVRQTYLSFAATLLRHNRIDVALQPHLLTELKKMARSDPAEAVRQNAEQFLILLSY